MSLQILLDSFQLQAGNPSESFAEFIGYCEDSGAGRAYGGHVMAQAMSAAQRTVDPAYWVHSMNCNFYRPGAPEQAIHYRVEQLRNGRSFATRLVQAYQDEKPIFTATLSFQTEESSFEHSVGMPEVVAPEALDSNDLRINEYFEQNGIDHKYSWPIDVRYADPVDILNPQPKEPRDLVWMKANGEMPDDPHAHLQMFAYGSDNPIGSPAFNPHGKNPFLPDVMSATISHNLWIHRPVRMDEWLLFDINSDVSHGGRGMAHGRVFNQQQQLVASVAQELVMRLRR